MSHVHFRFLRDRFCYLFLLSVFAIFSACDKAENRNTANPSADAYIYVKPDTNKLGLPVESLTAQGVDESLITAMVKDLLRNRYGEVDSILIYQNGFLLLEEYFNGYDWQTRHDIRSATKSITSILVGIAIDHGNLAGENDPVYEYFSDYNQFAEWSNLKEQITVKHLLTMSGGLDCNDQFLYSNGRENSMYRQSDWIKYILDLPIKHLPGKQWSYCTGGVVVLGGVVQRATSRSVTEFSYDHLFKPLGISNYHWSLSPDEQIDTGGHLFITPGGLLKLGIMMLQNGIWGGKQIVSANWVDKSFAPYFDWYGYLWWRMQYEMNAQGGAPAVDIFYANGNGGNFIFIVPDKNLVVVFTGSNFGSSLSGVGRQLMLETIMPAIQ